MFYCNGCGYKSIKWLGKCPLCGGWETFVEEKEVEDRAILVKDKIPPRPLKEIEQSNYTRIVTGIDEFDRCIGGGLLKGEIILLGGEPGVGKSTLLIEICSSLSKKDKVLYVSAEESSEQVALRAKRVNSESSNLYILVEDNLEEICHYIKDGQFKFVVIDSIQVIYSSRYDGTKGSLSQVRGCADYLTSIAKSLGAVIFVVGHVTKEGAIAGPKSLEHIVDCVLYFEGDELSHYRILRSSKNRFGPTGDIAVFEMCSDGLKEVKTITDVFLPHRDKLLAGSCVVCVIEGVRPILVELQSLVSRASFGVVRRRCLGFDFNRFSLLIAIIEKRLKISLGSEDVFLNVAGGLRLTDPAADLGAAVAIVSSFKEKETSLNCIFLGEVGLGGEIRRINNINARLKEVERANFKRCFIPESNSKEVDSRFNFTIELCASLKEVVEKGLS